MGIVTRRWTTQKLFCLWIDHVRLRRDWEVRSFWEFAGCGLATAVEDIVASNLSHICSLRLSWQPKLQLFTINCLSGINPASSWHISFVYMIRLGFLIVCFTFVYLYWWLNFSFSGYFSLILVARSYRIHRMGCGVFFLYEL